MWVFYNIVFQAKNCFVICCSFELHLEYHQTSTGVGFIGLYNLLISHYECIPFFSYDSSMLLWNVVNFKDGNVLQTFKHVFEISV
jgi:hypothetical protein